MTEQGQRSPASDAPQHVVLETTRIRVGELLHEAFVSLAVRPGRTMMTSLGTAMSIAAFISTIGLSRTAGGQVLVSLDKLRASSVDASLVPSQQPASTLQSLPLDAPERVTDLSGVEAAAECSALVAPIRVRANYVLDPTNEPSVGRPIFVASPSLPSVTGARFSTGRMFDQGNSDRHERVAVIGGNLAKLFAITDITAGPAIFLNDTGYTVVGVIDSTDRRRDLLDAVIIPRPVNRLFGYVGPTTLLVKSQVGGAPAVAANLAVALNPADPTRIQVRIGSQPTTTRQKAKKDLDALYLGLGAITAIIGAIGIANMGLVAVFERIGEIGLRRSLGARSRHIAAQFLVESVVVGVMGGVLGSTFGVLVIVGVSAVKGWVPVLNLWMLAFAPLVGGIVGLLSGLWPAIRAARLEPVEAIRRGG
jgi:ABC-type antimicrobial peptide transport system permease subunit